MEAEPLALADTHAEDLFERALALQQAGQSAEAETLYRALLKQTPGHVAAHFNLGVLCLAREAWREGFQHLEWRLQKPGGRFKVLPCPRWQGQRLSGQRILVLAEYGYGDMIQFWRFLAPLCDLAQAVILQVPAVLLPLAQQLDLPLTLLAEGQPWPDCDYCLPMMSLPHGLGMTQTSEIAPLPPWKFPLRVGRASRFPAEIQRVGLVWQGRKSPVSGPKTAYQALQLRKAFPLALVEDWMRAFPELEFYAFQPDLPACELPQGLCDLGRPLTDFAQTAEGLLNMDVVIAVDTAVVHLSASLGVPTQLLLPHPSPWIWPTSGERSPWYPSLRIFRQLSAADWTGPALEIQRLLSQTSGTNGMRPA